MNSGRVELKLVTGATPEGARRIPDGARFLRESGLLFQYNAFINHVLGYHIDINEMGVVEVFDYGSHPSVLISKSEWAENRRRMVATMDERRDQIKFRKETFGAAIQNDAITLKFAPDVPQ